VDPETGVTDTAHSLAPELVHVRPCLTEGGHTNLDVMIAIVREEEGMGEEDHQGGIYTGRTPGRARDHLFLAEGTDCRRGDDRRVMSVGEQVMGGEDDGLDLGVIRYDRVGRGLSHVLVRDRGRILRIQGIVGVDQGQAAEEGGLSAISEIAGRGRHDFIFVFFWLTTLTLFVIHLSQMQLLRKN
jgi:hypothetical protein